MPNFNKIVHEVWETRAEIHFTTFSKMLPSLGRFSPNSPFIDNIL